MTLWYARILAGILQILHDIIRRGYRTQCAGDDSRPVAVYPLSGTHIQILKGLAVRVIQQDRIGFPLLKHITLSPLPQRHNNGKHGAPFSVRTYSLYALPSDAGKISKIPISTRCFSREARIFLASPKFFETR